jgi:hypothetical protein
MQIMFFSIFKIADQAGVSIFDIENYTPCPTTSLTFIAIISSTTKMLYQTLTYTQQCS